MALPRGDTPLPHHGLGDIDQAGALTTPFTPSSRKEDDNPSLGGWAQNFFSDLEAVSFLCSLMTTLGDTNTQHSILKMQGQS
jgi:hypothetical protein